MTLAGSLRRCSFWKLSALSSCTCCTTAWAYIWADAWPRIGLITSTGKPSTTMSASGALLRTFTGTCHCQASEVPGEQSRRQPSRSAHMLRHAVRSQRTVKSLTLPLVMLLGSTLGTAEEAGHVKCTPLMSVDPWGV